MADLMFSMFGCLVVFTGCSRLAPKENFRSITDGTPNSGYGRCAGRISMTSWALIISLYNISGY